jgi:2,4-dienoyl-CoA reductase (NADPH2)
VQIVHAGRYAGPWDEYESRRRLAPSAIGFPLLPGLRVTPQEITTEEIEAAVQSFAYSAALAEEAGFDGVEIHGAQGFLISSFQSPRMNLRVDDYGREPNKFPLRVIDAVRAAVSPEFLVGYHLFAGELMPGGWDADDAIAFSTLLPDHGVDFVIPMVSTFESLRAEANVGLFGRPQFQRDVSSQIARACSAPVFTNGQLADPDLAADIVMAGEAAMVGLGRPILADPEWPIKVRDGRLDEIVACACHPPRCLQTQLAGVVCSAWPSSAQDCGFLGYETSEELAHGS